MLQTLRKSASGIVAKILMALLIVSFGIWGIADVFRGFGSQTLATIGSTEITVPEFRQLYQDRLQQISQQIKRGLTPDQARAIGIPDQLLNERLAEAALDDRVRQLGLSLSDEEIARRVRENPAFRGPSGTFDPNYFAQILRANGYTEPRFVEAERRLALRQQLIGALSGGVELPQVLKDAVRRFESEERSVAYLTIDPPALDTIADPTDDVLKAFFDARKVAFRAPEYRSINVLALTPERLAATLSVSDDELKAAYDANPARIGTPEQRAVQQIVFANPEEAKTASDRIIAGTPFGDIAAEMKLNPKDIDLGTVSRGQIVDKAVADAAFALPENGTSGVVEGRFGPILVHVGAVTPATIKPLADVSGDLRTELQTQKAQKAMLDKHDQVEDERASGASVGEVAKKLGLEVTTLEADRQGKAPDGSSVAEDLPGRADVLAGAFDSDVGVEADPVQLPNGGGYIWYEVGKVTPSRDRTFEEARAQVLDRFKQDEASKQTEARLTELRGKLDAGEPLEKVAADAGLEVKTAAGLRRGRAVDGAPQGIISAVFETKDGTVGSAPTDVGDGRVLFKVTGVTVPPTGADDTRLLGDLRERLEQDLMTEYLVKLQSDLGVRVNRAALDQIVGGDVTN